MTAAQNTVKPFATGIVGTLAGFTADFPPFGATRNILPAQVLVLWPVPNEF
jgi:hypothetical protein